MTPQERAKIIVSIANEYKDKYNNDWFVSQEWDLQDYIREAIDKALDRIVPLEIHAERERCAGIVQEYIDAGRELYTKDKDASGVLSAVICGTIKKDILDDTL